MLRGLRPAPPFRARKNSILRFLLTGASGFVGGHFRAHLPASPLAGPGGERIDLRDEPAVRAAVDAARPEAVVPLAALSYVPESIDNPREAITVNVVRTLNLLSALQDCGFRGRMVFVGSAEAYGAVSPEELPIVETRPLRPRNPYAASKAATEALAYQWSQTAEFDIVMARPFDHIGPGQQPRLVVSDFARRIAKIKLGRKPPVVRVGELDATRDFTDLRYTVRAYALPLEHGANAARCTTFVPARSARPTNCWAGSWNRGASRPKWRRKSRGSARPSRADSWARSRNCYGTPAGVRRFPSGPPSATSCGTGKGG